MTGAALALTVLAAWLWTGADPCTARLRRIRRRRTIRSASFRDMFIARSRPAGREAAWRVASIELCQGLAAELSAGRTAGEALVRAVQAVDFPDPLVLRPVVAAARDGGDVPAALLAVDPGQGGDAFRRLAACWRVSVTTGAVLATLVDRVAGSLREAQAHRRDVVAQLAGPRATARLLAGLPLLGLLMAAGLGMRPLHFLFGGPAGMGCLFIGLALDLGGLWWTRHLVARAQRA